MTAFTNGHALLIGVGADLPNTEDDAKGLAAILADAERCAFPPGNVVALTGANAQRENILDELDALAKRSDNNSTVIVFFSGHGYRVETAVADLFFLMPYGYAVDQLKKTAVSGPEFAERLKAIPAQRTVVLLDCCHAGGVGQEKSVPAGVELSKAPLPPDAQNLFSIGAGRVLIASSRADELSFAGKPYSAFTLALIEAFAGEGAAKDDGYVRWTDLALYASTMVPQRTKKRQHPMLELSGADNFVLAYYAGGATKKKGLPFEVTPEIEVEPGAFAAAANKAGRDINIAGRDNITAGRDVNFAARDFFNLAGAHGSVINPTGPVSMSFDNRKTDTGGGANVSGNVSGDLIGRDRTVHGNEIHGNSGITAAELQPFINALTGLVAIAPAHVQADATAQVEELKTELQKGDKASDGRVAKVLDGLVALVPAAIGAVVSMFASPLLSGVAGSATQSVLERIRGK